MAVIETTEIGDAEIGRLLALTEGHFCDLKSIQVKPAKLTRALSAFCNAEGGELYIGVNENGPGRPRSWSGFGDPEDANGFLQTFEKFFPLGRDFRYAFLHSATASGYVLKVEVDKTRDIRKAADGKVYIRRGAQCLPVEDEDDVARLRRDKGLVSYETEPVNADPALVTNSTTTIRFMLEVIPTSEPEPWLAKQQVVIGGLPTVAGLVLFAEEPQAVLPKRCGIKIYRYATTDAEGSRETLVGDPASVEGCAYDQIAEAVRRTAEMVESVRVKTPTGLEPAKYPITALHEIITNAVLHRDYSIPDDIHIRIFNNRVEVSSPGTLPGHVTEQNILEERFARNGMMVRLINKFPDPPNKDVGEGLNTAFAAMREMKLKVPVISQRGGYVTVILRHEPLAAPEETILEYLQSHEQIRNREAREICFIGSENKMKNILQSMVSRDLIELVPGTTRYTAAYRLRREA
jgi:ATP-dependent DNA helicase RecG